MKKNLMRSVLVVLCMAVGMSAAMATEDSKKASHMLFEGKHIANLAPGTVLTYDFKRDPSNAKVLGPGFTDIVTVKINKISSLGKRNVTVQMFSGTRQRQPMTLPNMDGNPILVAFLETSLGHFRLLAGGDKTYLKNIYSKALGDSSTLKPVKITYKGQVVDGYRVDVKPFVNDPSRSKMQGYEGAEFSFFISDKIPGSFAKLMADYNNTQKIAPTLVETMTLEGVGEIK